MEQRKSGSGLFMAADEVNLAAQVLKLEWSVVSRFHTRIQKEETRLQIKFVVLSLEMPSHQSIHLQSSNEPPSTIVGNCRHPRGNPSFPSPILLRRIRCSHAPESRARNPMRSQIKILAEVRHEVNCCVEENRRRR